METQKKVREYNKFVKNQTDERFAHKAEFVETANKYNQEYY